MPSKKKTPRGPQLKIAGAISVAFVNTASARDKNRQVTVDSYATLVTWSQEAELLSMEAAERLRRRAAIVPKETEAVFDQARNLRNAFTRLFVAREQAEIADASDLAVVHQALDELTPPMRLIANGPNLVRHWVIQEDSLDPMLWPILQSATELLTSETRVGRCAAPGCDLMFVDDAPRGPRRWCEAKTCGNRMKSLRYYHRKGKESRRGRKDWLFR